MATPPSLSLEELGTGLHRPECVLGTRSGDVFVSDWRGGVTSIRPDGSQRSWLAQTGNPGIRPNGIAIDADGSFLLAHLGDTGGIWRLRHDGSLSPVLLEVDGVELPPTNFVTVDDLGRLWISVSTRQLPRQLAWRPDLTDGFVVLVDARGARIVADRLHYTNEVRPDPSGEALYVVETFGRRLLRFPIDAGGSLRTPEIVVNLGHGCFPDGFAFDQSAGIWITSLVSNRLLRLIDDDLETLIEDANPEYINTVEAAFSAGQMAAEHLGPVPGTRLQHLTSVAFGGPDLRTGYLGSLHARCIYRFRSPEAGVPAPHWRVTTP